MRNKKRSIKWLLCIASLALTGAAFTALHGDAAGKIVESYPYVEVSVGEGEYYAVVGNSFSLFSARAIDDEGTVYACTERVYYNYRSDKRVNVPVENGAFVPTREGVYTIVWSASDDAGNTVTEEYDVTAYAESPLVLTVGEESLSSAVRMQTVVNAPAVEFASGDYEIGVTATVGDVKYTLEETADGYAFVPMHAGDFVVEYVYTDHTQTKKCTVSLQVASGTGYEFVEAPALPDYFINNATYALDDAFYYDMEEPALTAREVEYKIVYDGSGEEIAVGETLKIAGSEKAVLYAYAGEVCFYEKEIVVVDCMYDADTGIVDMRNYFVDKAGDFVVAENLKNADYPTYVTDKDASLDFVNKLLVNDFYMRLAFGWESQTEGEEETATPIAYADTLKITLTDWYDADKKLEISLMPKENGSDLSVVVNGIYENTATACSYQTGKELDVRYQATTNTLTIGSSAFSLAGVFEPFERSYARLNVAVEGVDETVRLSFMSLNNQARLYIRNIDVTTAQRYIVTNANYFSIGSVLDFRAIASDVVSPDSSLRISLITPSGGYAKDKNGLELKEVVLENRNYQVELTEYGTYALAGISYDACGNRDNISLSIHVVDYEPPEVMAINPVREAKVGQSKTLAFAVEDALENDLKMRVVVYDAASVPEIYDLENGSLVYKFTKAGTYVVSCYCYDSYGNMGVCTYTVKVG